MTDPKMALWERVSDALGGHDVHPEDRDRIVEATGDADSWDDVDPAIRSEIEALEKAPRQTWDDPADIPGR